MVATRGSRGKPQPELSVKPKQSSAQTRTRVQPVSQAAPMTRKVRGTAQSASAPEPATVASSGPRKRAAADSSLAENKPAAKRTRPNLVEPASPPLERRSNGVSTNATIANASTGGQRKRPPPKRRRIDDNASPIPEEPIALQDEAIKPEESPQQTELTQEPVEPRSIDSREHHSPADAEADHAHAHPQLEQQKSSNRHESSSHATHNGYTGAQKADAMVDAQTEVTPPQPSPEDPQKFSLQTFRGILERSNQIMTPEMDVLVEIVYASQDSASQTFNDSSHNTSRAGPASKATSLEAVASLLDNVTFQILHVIATAPRAQDDSWIKIKDAFRDAHSPIHMLLQAYLRTRDFALRRFNSLSPEEAANPSTSLAKATQIANLASAAIGILGVGPLVPAALHDDFSRVFLVSMQHLTLSVIPLLIEVKTQACLAALVAGHSSWVTSLEHFFPVNIGHIAFEQDIEVESFQKIAAPLINAIRRRKEELGKLLKAERDILQVGRAFPPGPCIFAVVNFVSANFFTITGKPMKTLPSLWDKSFLGDRANFSEPQLNDAQRSSENGERQNPTSATPETHQRSEDATSLRWLPQFQARFRTLQNQSLLFALPPPDAITSSLPIKESNSSKTKKDQSDTNTSKQATASAVPVPLVPSKKAAPFMQHHFPPPGQNGAPTVTPFKDDEPAVNPDDATAESTDQSLIPNPQQSAPTAVLYERARQASSTKAPTAAATTSRAKVSSTNSSQRRPWTAEEEQALMAGLDYVKGPHWSQILNLYGTGGSLGDSLAARSQVQLKDKARNLKLFFLKSKIEVPYYLQFVTGELKSRAPGHVPSDPNGEAVEPGSANHLADRSGTNSGSGSTNALASRSSANSSTHGSRNRVRNSHGNGNSRGARRSAMSNVFPPHYSDHSAVNIMIPAPGATQAPSGPPTMVTSSIASSAAEEAARAIAALMGQGTIKPQATPRPDAALESTDGVPLGSVAPDSNNGVPAPQRTGDSSVPNGDETSSKAPEAEKVQSTNGSPSLEGPDTTTETAPVATNLHVESLPVDRTSTAAAVETTA